MERTRRAVLRSAGVVGLAGVAWPSAARGELTTQYPTRGRTGPFATIRVPRDQPTIQDGVDAATAGDLVLVEPGTYAEPVEISTPAITVRGTDRNAVVLDGEFVRSHAVRVEADGVALENLTARHYTGNAFYWRSVEGFRGSYLTAHTNGYYGVYAYDSIDGRFEHSYASGHPDAGFYLGRNDPFDAVISNVTAEHNGLGYSGTSTGANLTIEHSTWRNNVMGIVPNTLGERDQPQFGSRIVDNVVRDNGVGEGPFEGDVYPIVGAGIVVLGGHENLIEGNEVRDNEDFGIVVQPNVVEPGGNVVRDNDVDGSGVADLALGDPAGEDNRFEDNAFATSLPGEIERDASRGSERVSTAFEEGERRGERGEFPSPDWRDAPTPDDQPTMPDPEAPPRPATRTSSWPAPGS